MSKEMHESITKSMQEFDFSKYEILNQNLIEFVMKAGSAGLDVRRESLSTTVKSSKEDIVTSGDELITEILKPQIEEMYPDIKFLDEESKDTHGIMNLSGLTAVLDPIDGTGNYYNGFIEGDEKKMTQWGMSLVFVKDGEFVAGIIHQPDTNTTYFAERGKGAYKNGERIHVSLTTDVKEAKLISSPPYVSDEREFEISKRAIQRFSEELEVMTQSRGSQVLEIAEVAEGNADVFIHFKTKPWDVAAGIVIAKEAGGKVFTTTGDTYRPFGENIIISNGNIDLSPVFAVAAEEINKDTNIIS